MPEADAGAGQCLTLTRDPVGARKHRRALAGVPAPMAMSKFRAGAGRSHLHTVTVRAVSLSAHGFFESKVLEFASICCSAIDSDETWNCCSAIDSDETWNKESIINALARLQSSSAVRLLILMPIQSAVWP